MDAQHPLVVESRAPASLVQRSMWAAAKRLRGVPLNVMMIPWHVVGPIDADALCAAVSDVQARHSTLRSVLHFEGGELFQVTLAPAPLPVVRVDVLDGPSGARLERALERLRAEARAGIDIERGPTLRAWLFRLGPAEYVLGLITHHAMCDGWSTQLLLRDVAQAYRARARGEAADPPPVGPGYALLAAELSAAGARGDFARELAYWARQVDQPPAALALPARVARKGLRDHEARSVIQSEPAEVMQRVRSFARSQRASVFAVMLSALAVTLKAQTGAQDMLLGVSTLNRWSAAAREVVGCFTTILPARLRPRDGLTLQDLVAQSHGTLRELMAYGRVPFELIVRQLQSGFGTAPLLPVWCQLLEPGADASLPEQGVTFRCLRIERAAMQCEIEFDLLDAPHGLECDLAHRAALFDEAQVQTLGHQFRAALHALSDEDERYVDALVERVSTIDATPVVLPATASEGRVG